MNAKAVLVSFAALALFADVAPRCGERRRVEVHPAKAWTPCDPKGPHTFECEPPTSCFFVGRDVDAPGVGQVCTKACSDDGDCAPMGEGFTCSGRATSGAGAPPVRVCVKRASDGGGSSP